MAKATYHVGGAVGRSTTRQTVSVIGGEILLAGHQRRPVQRIVGRVVKLGGDAHRFIRRHSSHRHYVLSTPDSDCVSSPSTTSAA